MNIYLVTRTNDHSWDEYDSFICVANTPEEARNLHPDGYSEGDWWNDDYNYSWVPPASTEAKLLGKADPEYTKPKVILASYNAG